jgi:hypothetical protein
MAWLRSSWVRAGSQETSQVPSPRFRAVCAVSALRMIWSVIVRLMSVTYCATDLTSILILLKSVVY